MLREFDFARDWLGDPPDHPVVVVEAQASASPTLRTRRRHASAPRARVLIGGARGGAALRRRRGPLRAGPRAVGAPQAVNERCEEAVVEELRRVAPGLGVRVGGRVRAIRFGFQVWVGSELGLGLALGWLGVGARVGSPMQAISHRGAALARLAR